MPAKSKKQKRFFGAVEGAKHGQKNVSGKAKKVAKEISDEDAKKFLHTADEDNEEPKKDEKPYQKRVKGQEIKGGLDTKTKLKPKKDNTIDFTKEIKRRHMKENADIDSFIQCLLVKNYASANKYLNNAVESKLLKRIEEELETPLFHTYE